MTRALGTPAALETKASICKDLPFCECRASRRAIGVCRIFGTLEVLVFHSGAFAFGTLQRAFAETNALGIPAASDTKASIFNYLLLWECRASVWRRRRDRCALREVHSHRCADRPLIVPGPQPLERRYQHRARPEMPGFHRRDARSKPLSRFSRTEFIEIAKDHNLTIRWRELGHGVPNRPRCLAARQSVVRRVVRGTDGIEIGR